MSLVFNKSLTSLNKEVSQVSDSKHSARPRDYAYSVFAIVVMMAGTALVTTSQLGTPPVSSPVYAMTLIGGLSFGGWTFALNLFLIAAQWVMLRQDFPRRYWLQLPALLVGSVSLDLWMYVCRPLASTNYAAQVALVAVGLVVLGFGVAILATANAVFLPGEGFVATVATLRRKPFYKVKLVFDIVCVLLALVLSVLWVGHFEAAREATIVSALTLGFIVGAFTPVARRLVKPVD